jgi:hypothetical protein
MTGPEILAEVEAARLRRLNADRDFREALRRANREVGVSVRALERAAGLSRTRIHQLIREAEAGQRS